MEKINWKYIKEFILNTLNLVELKLDQESIEFIKHYINHDEFEMAFEILFIEIMKLSEVPQVDLLQSEKIGEILKLNEESIFDFEFWEKFKAYVSKNNNMNNHKNCF